MGCMFCCCSCCKSAGEKKVAKEDEYSGLETLRPAVLQIKHSSELSPFLNMNPVLVDSSANAYGSNDNRISNSHASVPEVKFTSSLFMKK